METVAKEGQEAFQDLELDVVVIIINDKKHRIKAGVHAVAEIKKIGGVAQADELNQLIDEKLVPLPDDGKIRIKGREEFVSQPRSGGASYRHLG